MPTPTQARRAQIAAYLLLVWALAVLGGCASMSTAEWYAIGGAAAGAATTAYGLEQGLTEQNDLLRQDTTAGTVGAIILTSVGAHFLIRWITKKLDINPWVTFGSYGSLRYVMAGQNLAVIEGDQ